MIGRTDGNGVIVLVRVIAISLEQVAKLQERLRGLVLGPVDVASHRFADMKPGEFFLFDDDWLDPFLDQEHCRGRPAGSSADN